MKQISLEFVHNEKSIFWQESSGFCRIKIFGLSSTYLQFSDFACILNVSFHDTICVQIERIADMIWEKDNYTISSEKQHVDIDTLHDMLSRSYWAKDRSREAVVKSVETSLCFSLLINEEQIGFARVLTDEMAYAVILDMIIRKEFRGQGLGKWLVQCIFDHPEVMPLRQVLWTGDADDFYRQTGFVEMSNLKFMARNWVM